MFYLGAHLLIGVGEIFIADEQEHLMVNLSTNTADWRYWLFYFSFDSLYILEENQTPVPIAGPHKYTQYPDIGVMLKSIAC